LARRVREACLEKLASLCGADAVSPSLPVPPSFDEPLPAHLPPPPADPADVARWAASVAELAEARARESELRGREAGLREGEAKGLREGHERGQAEGEARGKAEGLREGHERGQAEGETRGKAEGLRIAVLDACELLGIVPTDAQRAQLAAMTVGELETLRQALKRERRWLEAALASLRGASARPGRHVAPAELCREHTSGQGVVVPFSRCLPCACFSRRRPAIRPIETSSSFARTLRARRCDAGARPRRGAGFARRALLMPRRIEGVYCPRLPSGERNLSRR
ncbi:MAG: hypothetical protein MUF34_11100, partial [Polyangiaceae bacterium]|nr:hypothetical protein [Polyangiaceae bacterium]